MTAPVSSYPVIVKCWECAILVRVRGMALRQCHQLPNARRGECEAALPQLLFLLLSNTAEQSLQLPAHRFLVDKGIKKFEQLLHMDASLMTMSLVRLLDAIVAAHNIPIGPCRCKQQWMPERARGASLCTCSVPESLMRNGLAQTREKTSSC